MIDRSTEPLRCFSEIEQHPRRIPKLNIVTLQRATGCMLKAADKSSAMMLAMSELLQSAEFAGQATDQSTSRCRWRGEALFVPLPVATPSTARSNEKHD
ncbi:hypothetical protein ACQR1H_31155 [Bradyrhizobium sp. HKCCYLRH2015]|uniref:hypothetical protein n=1 Tax=Bradyrhizobium TaxID=374 RepID=UPI003EB82A18